MSERGCTTRRNRRGLHTVFSYVWHATRQPDGSFGFAYPTGHRRLGTVRQEGRRRWVVERHGVAVTEAPTMRAGARWLCNQEEAA